MNRAKQLEKFEKEIADIYEDGAIKAPIHLRDGNERELVNIFKGIRTQDHVFSTWASHMHAILKGVPVETVRQDILDGKSITLNYPDHNFYSSAIVGGTAAIAVGLAHALQRQGKDERVFCFLGDMGFTTGIVSESVRWSIGHDLPITWIVEDNGKSVGTPTDYSWGGLDVLDVLHSYQELAKNYNCAEVKFEYYHYEMEYPHSGVGKFIEF